MRGIGAIGWPQSGGAPGRTPAPTQRVGRERAGAGAAAVRAPAVPASGRDWDPLALQGGGATGRARWRSPAPPSHGTAVEGGRRLPPPNPGNSSCSTQAPVGAHLGEIGAAEGVAREEWARATLSARRSSVEGP